MRRMYTPHALGVVFAILAAFLFSSKSILIKQAYALSPVVDATVLMTLRMGCALPFFLLIAWLSRKQRQTVSTGDWLMLFFAGILGYYFSSWLDFLSLMFISASLERIILFLYPTFTVLASSVLFKHRLSAHTLIALLLSYGGTLLMMWQEQTQTAHSADFWWGSSLVLASAVCFAAYLLLNKPLIAKFGSWHFTGLALSIACLATLLHFYLVTPEPIQQLRQLPEAVWGYGLVLGFFVTVLPTLLVAHSIARLGPAKAAMLASVGPVLTIFLAIWFLGEQLNALQWLGCSLNIIGVMMISLRKA